LAEQQGMHHLADAFRLQEIDEAKLTNLDVFTEAFVQEQLLGVTANKITCKKLVMAAKRLANNRNEFPPGFGFDSSENYECTLGSGKLIRGMEEGLASMKPGEEAELSIRSDYAYGAEGYRKRNGDVLVPPFATLSFEVKLN
jgi:FKBP-type peptidyl-prolyl cis-trans isomerase